MTGLRTDKDLLEAACGGDRGAFSELIERYQREVFRVVSKHVPAAHADEVSQAAFVSAFRGLGTFRHDGPFLHWITKVALRRCYDFWRSHSRRQKTPEVALTSAEWQQVADRTELGPENGFSEDDGSPLMLRALDGALSRLSAADRMVIVLVHLEERPLREVAEVLETNVIALKVRAHRARKKLRALIERGLK